MNVLTATDLTGCLPDHDPVLDDVITFRDRTDGDLVAQRDVGHRSDLDSAYSFEGRDLDQLSFGYVLHSYGDGVVRQMRECSTTTHQGLVFIIVNSTLPL